jgi:hypothetical protein
VPWEDTSTLAHANPHCLPDRTRKLGPYRITFSLSRRATGRSTHQSSAKRRVDGRDAGSLEFLRAGQSAPPLSLGALSD